MQTDFTVCRLPVRSAGWPHPFAGVLTDTFFLPIRRNSRNATGVSLRLSGTQDSRVPLNRGIWAEGQRHSCLKLLPSAQD